MRLHMEGVKIGPRAQEVARAYKDTLDYRGLFYDGHACFATLHYVYIVQYYFRRVVKART